MKIYKWKPKFIFKNILQVVVNEIPDDILKLSKVEFNEKNYNFEKIFECTYKHQRLLCSLKELQDATRIIVFTHIKTRKMFSNGFDINECQIFVNSFGHLFSTEMNFLKRFFTSLFFVGICSGIWHLII